MSTTNLAFLQHDPTKGASVLFEDSSLDNNKLWNIFDFLLWRGHQNHKLSLNLLLSWYREISCLGQDFKKTFCSSSHKFVCGQTITTGDPIYRCRTCQSDNNTLICVDCFKGSNHDGHDWFATYTNGSGCCDCGDPLSWDPKGFCTKHPGPAAGDNIKIDLKLEEIARLVSGYIIYIISHSMDDNNHDVIYLSNYKQCQNSVFFKSFNKSHPLQKKRESSNNDNNNRRNSGRTQAIQQLMNSPLWGFFNRQGSEQNNPQMAQILRALQAEANDDENDDEEYTFGQDETKEFEMGLKDKDKIQNDWDTFELMKKESKSNDRLLHVSCKDKTILEQRWDHPVRIITKVLRCSTVEANEIAWKLRMYNSVILSVGDEESVQKLQQVMYNELVILALILF